MIYDEGANNGTTSAYVNNRTQDVVFTFHTCDRIALRWQQNEYTTADIGYGR